MNRLKDLRLERALRQIDVANAIGVDRTTYTKYENGSSEPNFETIQKLATLFNVSSGYLMGDYCPTPLGSDNNGAYKKPPVSEDDERLEKVLANVDVKTREAIELLDQLTPDNLERAKEYIRFELAKQGDAGDKH